MVCSSLQVLNLDVYSFEEEAALLSNTEVLGGLNLDYKLLGSLVFWVKTDVLCSDLFLVVDLGSRPFPLLLFYFINSSYPFSECLVKAFLVFLWKSLFLFCKMA